MVFKLVNIDSENPFKIKLEPGNHTFGRGKFLNINDKRISRQHGQFEVTDDSLIVTALHQNPCFYQKSGTTQAQILKINNSVSLNTGDKLGLLPTSYWYEVLQCTPIDDKNIKTEKEYQVYTTSEITVDSGEETDNEAELRLDTVTSANTRFENDKLESQSIEVLSANELDKEQNLNDYDKQNYDSQNASMIEKTGVDSRPVTDFGSVKTHMDEPTADSLLSSSNEIEEMSNKAGPSKPPNSLPKRFHDNGEDVQSDEIKKIKTESEDKPNVKSDPDGQLDSSSDNNARINPQQGAPAPAPAPAPLRERCMYGASCYRRNPVHRAQFSHPHDADWGTGEKAPCPWGGACGKRDPRHWRDHDHPPGKDQPPPQPGQEKKRARSETPPHHLIVTGKRVRRSVMKASWSASDESDIDPYNTDEESDEWEPSTDYTESQN